jgi:hypothetical protein
VRGPSDDEGIEQQLRRQAELGRLLAAAAGFRVVASDGRQVGALDHVGYRRHADHPDEIIVRRRVLFPKRRRALPLQRCRSSEGDGADGRPAARLQRARALSVCSSLIEGAGRDQEFPTEVGPASP